MMEKRIVVVGAGIAGLTAAYWLQQAGLSPIVLEKSARVGGRMITDVVNGFTIDCGAQFLMEGYPILTHLIDELGLHAHLVDTGQYLGTVRHGEIRKTLRNQVLTPLQTGLLSFPAWLRFGLRTYPLFARIRSLPISDLAAWAEWDDQNAATWCNSYFGPEITDYFADPLLEGLFFQCPADASKALLICMIRAFLFEKQKTTTLLGGVGVLPQRLASGLDVRLSTPVRSLSFTKTGIELDTGAETLAADEVILATPAPVARALYTKPTTIETELLATSYSSSVSIAVVVNSSYRIDPRIAEIYGILVPKKERGVIASISNEGSKDKSRLGDGHMFTVFLSGAAGSAMIEWEEKRILSVVLEELDKYFVGLSGSVLFTRLYRWKEAVPMSTVGRAVKVAQ